MATLTVPMQPQPRFRPFQIHGDRPDRWWNENPNYPRRGPLLGKSWKAPHRAGDRIPEGTVVSCVPVRVEGVWCWVVETE